MTGIPEVEVAARLNKSRQTLRNWRKGYTAVNGSQYEPKLTEGLHWRKMGATVVYDEAWVEKMEGAMDEVVNLFK